MSNAQLSIGRMAPSKKPPQEDPRKKFFPVSRTWLPNQDSLAKWEECIEANLKRGDGFNDSNQLRAYMKKKRQDLFQKIGELALSFLRVAFILISTAFSYSSQCRVDC
jgi:hypothetical protein